MHRIATVLRGLAAGFDPVHRAAIDVVADAIDEEAGDKALLASELNKVRDDAAAMRVIAQERAEEIDELDLIRRELADERDQLVRERDELNILMDKQDRDTEAVKAMADRNLKRAEEAEIQLSRTVREATQPDWRLIIRRGVLSTHYRWAIRAYMAATGVGEDIAERWARNASEIGPEWPVIVDRVSTARTAEVLDILINQTVAGNGPEPCPVCPNDIRFERNCG
jgi:hypothetical protein